VGRKSVTNHQKVHASFHAQLTVFVVVLMKIHPANAYIEKQMSPKNNEFHQVVTVLEHI